MVLKMLEFRAVSSAMWLNKNFEILQMAALQGWGEQGMTVGPAGQHLPNDVQTCGTQVRRPESPWCQPPPDDHQKSLQGQGQCHMEAGGQDSKARPNQEDQPGTDAPIV